MAQGQRIEATNGVSRGYTTPVEKVTLTYGANAGVIGERSVIAGFNFINKFINDGYNSFTKDKDPLADGNGLLNMNGKYIINPETGVLEPPTRTREFIA